MRKRSKEAQNAKCTDARRRRFRTCELKPWIASALLPVCVECSDEIKIWSSVVAVSTIDASWQSVNDDDEAGKMMHGMWEESKTQNEVTNVDEPQMSEEQERRMKRKWKSWCSEAHDSHLEEYFHLAFINRSILRTKPMDTAGLKVALKEFQLVC